MGKWEVVYETSKSRKYSSEELRKLAQKKLAEYKRFGRPVKMTGRGNNYKVSVYKD
jgi:hypothetical protein